MSLWPRDPREVPAQTARVVRAVVPGGSFCVRLRDTLGVVFQDEAFTELFATRGRPAEAPGRLAIVSVLKFVEGLTDRQAADAVRLRLDWKYLLGLELEDQGFDASVLCEFRARLADSGAAEALVFEAVLERLAEAELVAPGGRQRTDSTVVLGQIRSLHRLELVGETLRAALEAVAACAPDWLRRIAPPEWFTRYGPRVEAYRLPKAASERTELAERIGRDGAELFARCGDDDAPVFLRELPAVQALRAVWVQQFYQDESGLLWRDRDIHGRPPGADAIVSPYDLDARYSIKRGVGWDGYKVQISESCDDELPHVITYVATVPATAADIDSTARVHQLLAERGLTPAEHLVDAAYVAADQILAARAEHGIDLVGPLTAGHSWQKKQTGAFDLRSFAVDWDRRIVTCPQGKYSRWWQALQVRGGYAVVKVIFSMKDRTPCPVRFQCTKAKVKARTLTLRPREHHELLAELRRTQDQDAWKARYAHRSGIEATISQAVRAFDLRRCRYRGHGKTAVQHVLIATAINLTRLDAWLCGKPLGPTRTSHLAALAPAT